MATEVMPELREILGAMIFAAHRPLSVREMRRCLVEVAAGASGEMFAFGTVKDRDIEQALEELRAEMERGKCGFALAEVAGGYRFQSRAACGAWVKHLLDVGKPSRLSRPALETLAIIAYRQPITRPEIEGVRGVNIDHVIRMLMELQLVRISGRSELPGRPLLYGTTQTFLDHFGLKDLSDLKTLQPLSLPKEKMAELAAAEPAAEPESAGAASLAPAASGPSEPVPEPAPEPEAELAAAEPAAEPEPDAGEEALAEPEAEPRGGEAADEEELEEELEDEDEDEDEFEDDDEDLDDEDLDEDEEREDEDEEGEAKP